jgi:hypothetical protein
LRQILSILIISSILFSSSQVFAQQLAGEKPNEKIKVRIDENGTAHVVHIVQGNSYAPVQVETIRGNMSNFSVTDGNNNTVQSFSIQTFPEKIIIPSSERNMTLIRYDLVNVLSFNDGVWKWKFSAPSDATFTDFYFPAKVDTVWVNDRPIYLGGHGLSQFGDAMRLEYVIDEPIILQNIRWQNYSFTVAIRTLSDVSQYKFDQPGMEYSLQVVKPNSFVTMIIPQALLGGNYTVHLNYNHLLTNIFHKNETHVWIGVRPFTNGTIQVIGTRAIPEFPMFLPLVMGITMILVLQFRTKLFY